MVNDPDFLAKEQAAYQSIPELRKADNAMVQLNSQQIKQEVQNIVETEMERILNDPASKKLIVKK